MRHAADAAGHDGHRSEHSALDRAGGLRKRSAKSGGTQKRVEEQVNRLFCVSARRVSRVGY
jgi:hypothetical protein